MSACSAFSALGRAAYGGSSCRRRRKHERLARLSTARSPSSPSSVARGMRRPRPGGESEGNAKRARLSPRADFTGNPSQIGLQIRTSSSGGQLVAVDRGGARAPPDGTGSSGSSHDSAPSGIERPLVTDRAQDIGMEGFIPSAPDAANPTQSASRGLQFLIASGPGKPARDM